MAATPDCHTLILYNLNVLTSHAHPPLRHASFCCFGISDVNDQLIDIWATDPVQICRKDRCSEHLRDTEMRERLHLWLAILWPSSLFPDRPPVIVMKPFLWSSARWCRTSGGKVQVTRDENPNPLCVNLPFYHLPSPKILTHHHFERGDSHSKSLCSQPAVMWGPKYSLKYSKERCHTEHL